ncbi:Aldo/keto reductase [Mycena alexandri]|uniref:Aldo/keto reductase n=1 Tax=Mycena alexandri TaxID=1745969 RepID=A0AAD6WVM4_9AGAR|nr:Aldo/keto reductase [Mycena alexandri]
MAATSALPVTLGLMTWGEKGKGDSRVTEVKECERMLDLFLSYGHKEVDTAYAYNLGTSEEYLGKIDYKSRGVVVDTKLYPAGAVTHSAADLRKFIEIQVKALKTDCIDLWYLHGPDRKTPYAETFKEVNELFKEGKFKRFGISNYMSWEVAEIATLCQVNDWVKPSAYQGIYNAVHRLVEPELFPCLRKFGIAFYGFNPLGGGFFTGKYDQKVGPEQGSRFDPKGPRNNVGFDRYWNDEYFQAVEVVSKVAEEHQLLLTEVAFRWCRYHSHMKVEHGDNLIIGASSYKQLDENLVFLEKGPLPDDIVQALDQAWKKVKGVAYQYWH